MERTNTPILQSHHHSLRHAMANIIDIEGIGETYAAKLSEAGISTTDALLQKCSTVPGRKELEAATGITGTLLLKWTNHADLFRIKGIASQYAELLEAAGVDTVPELAQRNSANLHTRLTEINEQKSLVRKLPSADDVAGWIAEAKQLPRVVQY